jgi:hypothetical protein
MANERNATRKYVRNLPRDMDPASIDISYLY